METSRTIIVGGGLAGLTAAATLATRGQPVTVVEGAAHLGGRARSRHRDGFDINLGPHALYRRVGGLDVLRRLGVTVRGRRPRLDRAGVFVGGEIVPARTYLLHQLSHRVSLAKALTGLGPKAAAGWSGRPVDEWLDAVTDDEAGRAFVASVVRTATYSADGGLLDAGAATSQLRAATHNVLYLHGGWSSLVSGLADIVRSHGGQIITGTTVEAVEHDRRADAVRLADGRVLPATAVVLAVNDPRRAAGLLDGGAAERLSTIADEVVPVRMAHLDVALRPLPTSRFPNVLGLDEPIYVTVPSDVAHVAPRGGAVVQVARYLRPGEELLDHRPSLEAVLDVHQPEWRDHVVDARYVPRSLVSGDHARVATDGLTQRPTTDAAGVDGIALAGDWVGPTGMLGDASVLSGARAAESIMAGMLDPVRRSLAPS